MARSLSWRGDLIGVCGFPGKTKAGELSPLGVRGFDGAAVSLPAHAAASGGLARTRAHLAGDAVPAALQGPAAPETQHTSSTCSHCALKSSRTYNNSLSHGLLEGGRGHTLTDVAQRPDHSVMVGGLDPVYDVGLT